MSVALRALATPSFVKIASLVVPLAFVLGLAGGLAITHWPRHAAVPSAHVRHPPSARTEVAADATRTRSDAPVAPLPTASSPARSPAQLALEFIAHGGDRARRFGAVLLAGQGVLLAPLSALDGVTRLALPAPLALPVGDVLAWDAEHDLVAIAVHGLPPGDATLAGESLYLGRECVLHTRDGIREAHVDSPLSMLADDTLGYALRLDAPAPDGLAALTDAGGETLVGIARASGGARGEAWDVAVVGALLDAAGNATGIPVTALTTTFFDATTEGRWLRYRNAVERADAETIVVLGPALHAAFPQRQARITAEVDQALDRLVIRELGAGRPDAALALVTAVDASLPASRARDVRRAGLLLRLERPREALAQLAPWLAQDPRADELLSLERAAIPALAATHPAPAELAALLDRAIARDARHAPYFVLRADLRATTGNHAGAHADYLQAIALDPRLERQLAPRLEREATRRDVPGTVVVPLARRGDGVVTASVTVNGLPRDFIIDTGASITAISTSLARALGVALDGPRVDVRTANGRTSAVRARIDSLALGALRLRQVPTLVIDGLDGHAGLLGLDVLARFDVDIDAARGELRLHPR